MSQAEMSGTVETYFAAVYWGPRPESAEACAERAARCLACLSRCDPSLARWYTLGETREAALTNEIGPDVATIRKLLLQDRIPFDDESGLGFALHLWNGAEDGESIGLHFYAGGSSTRVANTYNLSLQVYEGATPDHLLRVSPLVAVLRCMIRCCAPDWGVVTSGWATDKLPRPQNVAPYVGWLTYLSRQRGVPPPLPAPARTISLPGMGTLIVATEERFTARNVAHIATAAAVQQLLVDAGLAGPLR
jgi:hypothetical protein